ncbi:MAG: hypothetical protein EU551_03925 [Promethearchaeota archaeon]|nr:MAG: hypothetical protein EU551_03925 [Candidatus Lokiarchaeota archaeon]
MDIYTQLLWTLIIFVIFWVCLNGIVRLFKLQKKGIEVGPITLIAKTQKLNSFINRIARKFPRFWKVFFYIGIIFGYIGLGFVMYYLTVNLIQLIINPQVTNVVAPLIPGVTVYGQPLLYVLIAIGVIAVSHEFAHGIAARLDKVKLKSVGIMVLAVFFAAFVEIDEHSITKRKKLGRLSVFAAGSFANFVVGFFSFLVISSMYSNVAAGVKVAYSVADGPSYGILQPNDVIIEVNGTKISSGTDFDDQITNIKPLQKVNFTLLDLEPNTYRNELVRTGFNPSYTSTGLSRCRFAPEENITITEGVNASDLNLDKIAEVDNQLMNFSSVSNLLNLTFHLNMSQYSGILSGDIDKIMINISGKLNNIGNNISIYLINHTDYSNNLNLIIEDNISRVNYQYINISSNNYNLSQVMNDSIISCVIFINNTNNFNLSLNEFSFYIVTEDTIGWYGIYSYNYYPAAGLGQYIYRSLEPSDNPLFQTFFYIWLLSWGVAIMNLLPTAPFDGGRLITDLISEPGEVFPIPPEENGDEEEDKDKEKQKKNKKEKIPWTWKKILIWGFRIFAIFLLVANIALSIYWMLMTGNYNIFEFLL